MENKKIHLPHPSMVSAFSYKKRRFASISEFLIAPAVALCQHIDKSQCQQDISNYLNLIEKFNLLDLCMVKADVYRLLGNYFEHGVEEESSESDDDATVKVTQA